MQSLWNSVVVLAFIASTLALRAGESHHAQGEMAGEPTATTIILQSRLTAIPGPSLDNDGEIPAIAGVAHFEWSESADFAQANRSPQLNAAAESDFIVRAKLEELKPGTLYHYRLVFGTDETNTKTAPARTFKTLPDPSYDSPISFIMGSCQNYAFFMDGRDGKGATTSEEDRRLGFPSYSAMLALKPAFSSAPVTSYSTTIPKKPPQRLCPSCAKSGTNNSDFPAWWSFSASPPPTG